MRMFWYAGWPYLIFIGLMLGFAVFSIASSFGGFIPEVGAQMLNTGDTPAAIEGLTGGTGSGSALFSQIVGLLTIVSGFFAFGWAVWKFPKVLFASYIYIENDGKITAGEALKKSIEVTKGRWGTIVWKMILLLFALFVLGLIVGFSSAFLLGLLASMIRNNQVFIYGNLGIQFLAQGIGTGLTVIFVYGFYRELKK